MKLDLSKGKWHCPPKEYEVCEDSVTIITEAKKDFWNDPRSDFKKDDAPALLFGTNDETFSFTVKAELNFKKDYDQCGIVVYHDSDNWFKMSMEYQENGMSYLGGVLAQGDISDWASAFVDSNTKEIYYMRAIIGMYISRIH